MNNEFVANSKHLQEVKKLIGLVRGISVNTVIIGDSGVGKSHAAKLIIPNAVVVNGANGDELLKALKNFEEIIVEDFDKVLNPEVVLADGKKIVATSRKKIKDSTLDTVFGVKIDIEPLSKREDDIIPLVEYFLERAKKELCMSSDVSSESVVQDLSENCHTLKRRAYQALLCYDVNEEKLKKMMEEYFFANIEVEDNYKKFLELFDDAIINANHKKYGSQLMMSYRMGINRNTLRKKILQLNKKLIDE